MESQSSYRTATQLDMGEEQAYSIHPGAEQQQGTQSSGEVLNAQIKL